MKNYYEILEIDRSATQEEIKKAYRQKALQYHPDVSTDENSEEIIRNINEAFEVLSDKTKKNKYDEDILEQNISNFVKTNGDFYSSMSSFFYDSSHNIDLDIKTQLSISLKDALKGGKSSVNFDRILDCDTCFGKGRYNSEVKCSICNGLGHINNISVCKYCEGTGFEIELCKTCEGSKIIVKRESIIVKIPAITKENLLSNTIQLKYKKQGNSIYVGKSKNIGSLLVILNLVNFSEDNIIKEKDILKASIIIPMHYILAEKEIKINLFNIKTIELKLNSNKLYDNLYIIENVFNDIPLHLKVCSEIPQKKLSVEEKNKLIKVMGDIYGYDSLQLSHPTSSISCP